MDPITAGLVTAGAKIVGNILSKPKRISGAQSTMEAAAGAIQAQEEYGINALELIRSGSAGTSSGMAPRVGSTAMMGDAFDQIANVLTGREAQEAEAREVQTDLAKIELAQQKAKMDMLGKTTPAGSRLAPIAANSDTSKIEAQGFEKPETTPLENVPLTMAFRTGLKGGEPFIGLNPDAFEIGVGEILGSGALHGATWLYSKLPEFEVGTPYAPTSPKLRNPNPQAGWMDEKFK